jgi:EAL domain-containing protein (putative c-di-GMP-specific phosphodiesterase class I)
VGVTEESRVEPKEAETRGDTVSAPEPKILASIFPPEMRERAERPRYSVCSARDAELSTYREKFGEIKDMLVENRSLALLYVDASRLSQIEQDYGSKVYEDVLGLLTNMIVEMRGRQTRQDDLVTVNERHGDIFLIFLTKKREDMPFGRGDLEKLADRIHTYLSKRIYRMTCSYLRGRPKVSIGYSLVLHNPLIKEERLILKLVDEARIMATFQAYRLEVKNKELLQEIILKENIKTVFQPIVDMRNPSIHGYEALTRGPLGTEFESPYMLFDIAMESDLMFELDRLCRRRALTAATGLASDYKLFLNTLPMTIRDPDFQGKAMIAALENMKIDPSRIVLEVTERLAIENYNLFLEAMNYFTDMGFAVAVDDMGAGYSGLEKIVHLKPNYLKFDFLMVRDIDTSFVKQEMLRAILSLAENVGAKVIAEGVETEREHDTLLELGITYAQGFLFSKAEPGFVPIDAMPALVPVEESRPAEESAAVDVAMVDPTKPEVQDAGGEGEQSAESSQIPNPDGDDPQASE